MYGGRVLALRFIPTSWALLDHGERSPFCCSKCAIAVLLDDGERSLLGDHRK
ncbi:hypothetical protein [Dolichospermum sp. UHCC 0259]|uniref:hypothetical protein n=1 Tax=Dolichospermum sp. UHCC 0259 TaxID=2590010 RepID=UPI001445F1BF|nr:hypothetical protein [Dolichospermum sp. UHCC 0259]